MKAFRLEIIVKGASSCAAHGSGALTWSAHRPAAAGLWAAEDQFGNQGMMQVVADPFSSTERLWVKSKRGGYWPTDSDIFIGWRWAGPLPESQQPSPVESPDNKHLSH